MCIRDSANAVARQSQEVESYDRASDLEAISYDVMTMDAVSYTHLDVYKRQRQTTGEQLESVTFDNGNEVIL